MEEVVVTAQKRGDERLQDVPMPVSVLSATALLANGSTGIEDYFNKTPGISLVAGVGGTSAPLIRGVGNNGTNDNPTVGVSIDDAPYGATTFLGGGLQPIDMDPNEVSQVEVLRGPQGTLYGASSIGGLLRYVLVDPSLDEMSGRAMMSTQNVENGDGWDYSLRGAINLPIGSDLGLRASGFNRREAGFIGDTFTGKEGINSGHSYGGRLALLWRLNEDWSVNLSAIQQDLEKDAANVVDVDPLENERLVSSDYIPGRSGSNRKVTFLTGTVQGKLSNVDFTSISAYTSGESIMREAFTRGVFAAGAQFGGNAAFFRDDQEVSKFSQELRANIPLTDNIDWLVGAFYTEEKGDYLETISSGLRDNGAQTADADLFMAHSYLDYSEAAVFTNLTIRFTDRFDVQFGGRFSENRQTLDDERGGRFLGGGPFFLGPVRSKDSPFTYLVTPKFKVTEDWMVYARVASGYRPGGPTFNSVVTGGPKSLKADTTENYELGIKGEFLDQRVSVDLSTYYIDWEDIPVAVNLPGTVISSQVNAAGAISKGIELSLGVRPLEGLSLAAWGAWSDAYVSKLPSNARVSFHAGDRLPFSPHFSGNASIDYERTLSADVTGNIGAAVTYVGDRVHQTGRPITLLFDYTQVDAHIGVTAGSWTVNAFVNNVTDERGRIGRKPLDTSPTPVSVLIIRPRTIGLSVAKDF